MGATRALVPACATVSVAGGQVNASIVANGHGLVIALEHTFATHAVRLVLGARVSTGPAIV